MEIIKKSQKLSPEEQLERFEQLKQKVEKRKQMDILKSKLSSTDYQIIKCYEYSLAGLELPYDITLLHEEREAIREQIRALEDSQL